MSANMISFVTAISACGKEGRWERALALLHNMRKTANVIMALLREMCKAGMNANVTCLITAISACENGGQWE